MLVALLCMMVPATAVNVHTGHAENIAAAGRWAAGLRPLISEPRASRLLDGGAWQLHVFEPSTRHRMMQQLVAHNFAVNARSANPFGIRVAHANTTTPDDVAWLMSLDDDATHIAFLMDDNNPLQQGDSIAL